MIHNLKININKQLEIYLNKIKYPFQINGIIKCLIQNMKTLLDIKMEILRQCYIHFKVQYQKNNIFTTHI